MRKRAGRHVLESLDSFTRLAAPRPLRPYQLEAGEAIVRSVLRKEGKTFTILMARQSGKNELAAQVEAYLLHVFVRRGGQIVKAAPSYHPQIVNSVIRLQEVLSTPYSSGRWLARHGHSIELGSARVMFFSGQSNRQRRRRHRLTVAGDRRSAGRGPGHVLAQLSSHGGDDAGNHGSLRDGLG